MARGEAGGIYREPWEICAVYSKVSMRRKVGCIRDDSIVSHDNLSLVFTAIVTGILCTMLFSTLLHLPPIRTTVSENAGIESQDCFTSPFQIETISVLSLRENVKAVIVRQLARQLKKIL